MRKVQIAVVVFLIFIGIIISGEIYIEYISDFEDMPAVSFNSNNYNCKEMLNDLYNGAKEKGLLIGGISTQVDSIYTSRKSIYCDQEFKEYLEDNYYIKEGNQKALFSGKVIIKFDNFKDIPEERMKALVNPTKLYLVGSEEIISDFISEFSEKYPVYKPEFGAASRLREANTKLLLVWGLILVMIIIISYYVLQKEKKESVIRVTLGESAIGIFLKKAIIEIGIIGGSFEIISLIARILGYSTFDLEIVRMVVYATVLICVLMQGTVLKFDVSRVMSNDVISGEILFMNYIVKLLAVAVTVILVISEFKEINNYIDYKAQGKLFEYYKGYVNVNLQVKNYEEVAPSEYMEKLYRENIDKLQVAYFVDDTNGVSDIDIICANKNSVEYIKRVIPELSDYDFKEGVYFIYNKNTTLREDIKNEATDMASNLYDKEEEMKPQYLEYKEDVVLPCICIEEDRDSKNSKNPVIVLVNLSVKNDYNIGDGSRYLIFFEKTMWKATEKDIEQALEKISKDRNATAYIQDVYDSYVERLELLERTAYIKAVLIAALLLIVVIISRIQVQILYSSNEIEIAVKKTLGYSMFERYRKMYIYSGLINIIAIVSGIIYSKTSMYKGEGGVFEICFIGAFVMLLDFLIITLFISRNERVSVPKTLKGGCL